MQAVVNAAPTVQAYPLAAQAAARAAQARVFMHA
jgi:hypothetical protein